MISLHKLSCSQKLNLALCCRWHRFEKHVLASLGLLCAVTAFNRKQNWAMRNTLTRFDFTGKSSTKPRFRKKADSWRGPSVRFMFFLVTSPRRENTLWNVICLMHQLMNLMAVNHGCTRIIYPVLAPFRAQIPPLPLWTKHDACLWYGRIITSNHILPNKETISCVSRLCFRLPAETESAVMALTLHLPAHHLHSPAGERCWGVHLLILHHWLCIISELLMIPIIQLRQIYGWTWQQAHTFWCFNTVCNEVQIDSSPLQRCLHQQYQFNYC